MKKATYKVVFDDYSESKIDAFNAPEAKILAQAKRIEAGKPYAVRYVEKQDDYGVFEAIGIAHLEAVEAR